MATGYAKTKTKTKTSFNLCRTHFYNSKTSPDESSCLFIRVFGSCIVLLSFRFLYSGYCSKRGGGGEDERTKQLIELHAANFLSYLLAPLSRTRNHLCRNLLASSLAFAFRLFLTLLLFLCGQKWNCKCCRACGCLSCCLSCRSRCCRLLMTLTLTLTRPEVVQNLKRKSIVRQAAHWSPPLSSRKQQLQRCHFWS